ncbi:valine--tRNA ligase, mitochondrial 1-like isoform X2 [Olea europaea subsp. europaea]|uniref:valine--tRNA ligase n=1 Tax=Olea europaea subsp. europaea TaxID=158383 RepID=A0A8S0P899_OLEEU|nr:valine--tRNA ligase, mitochondrial 1-like isoform X2 [Olea europaea subsp. europaea]
MSLQLVMNSRFFDDYGASTPMQWHPLSRPVIYSLFFVDLRRWRQWRGFRLFLSGGGCGGGVVEMEAQKASSAPESGKKKNVKREAEENPVDYIDPETSVGEKKKPSRQMAKTLNANAVEKSWYAWWEKSKFFEADSSSSKPLFVIVLPPPNVTGALHIGHALTDTIFRWRRMSGYNTLRVPGMDHAGIATQVVVEKKIMREKKLTRRDVWKWKNEYGGTILKQLRGLGASLDWSRECFTMDEKRSRAVTEAFVRLYKDGLIYRDLCLVNWDCVLRTAISDIEVDYIEIKESTINGSWICKTGGVWSADIICLSSGRRLGRDCCGDYSSGNNVGDTAIAIYPEDPRYIHLHGKFAIHPFNGRRLPIVCDAVLVDMNIGTGCVKITPSHDPNDFEVGKRHTLDFINIFTDDGRIKSNIGPEFVGMPRFEARVAVTEALKEKGLYRGDKNNEMRLGICSRTNDVVEPLIKPQWYVNRKSMAQQALGAVMDDKSRKMEIVPKQCVAEWKSFGWGHRIPAWYAKLDDDELTELGAYNNHWVVARNKEEAQEEASRIFAGKKFELSQDPDVLDTWFSAGLFPLSVLGWPDDMDDLKAFYPTSVLEIGHDILFFWVARMVMLGMKLGGDVPSRKVYLRPMIRDAHGRKMSKSLGNVIDPLEVINGITLQGLHRRLEEGNLDPNELKTAKEGQVKDFPSGIPECGADALRFALVSYTAQSDKINLDVQRVIGYRQWCNKLWNAIRFAMSNLGDDYIPPTKIVPDVMPFGCNWIHPALNKAISKTVLSLESFEFSDAATAVYSWWQFQLCDVFIEIIKPYFASNNPDFASAKIYAQDTLWVCLDNGLRLLHLFMPFITEELWQRLPSGTDSMRKESIVICEYPSPVECWTNDNVELKMDMIESVVKSLRSLRPTLEPKERHERLAAYVRCRLNDACNNIKSHELEITTLATLSSLEVLSESDDALVSCKVYVVNEALSVFLKLQGNINIEAERQKLKKKMEMEKQRDSLLKMTSSSGYQEKVPAHIREENEAKLASLFQELLSFEEATSQLESASGNKGN